VHLKDPKEKGNKNPDNAGAVFFADIAGPLILWGALRLEIAVLSFEQIAGSAIGHTCPSLPGLVRRTCVPENRVISRRKT